MYKIKWFSSIKSKFKIGTGILTSNFLRMIFKFIFVMIVLNGILSWIDSKVYVSIRQGYEKMMIKMPPESTIISAFLMNNNIYTIKIPEDISISYGIWYHTNLNFDDILLYYEEEFENKGINMLDYSSKEDELKINGQMHKGNQQYLMKIVAMPIELDKISVHCNIYDNKTNVLYVVFKKMLYLGFFVLINIVQIKIFKKELIEEDCFIQA